MTGGSPTPATIQTRHLPRPVPRDVAFAVLVAVVELLLFTGILNTWPGVTGVAFTVVGLVPLAWRSVLPIPVFFFIWAHTAIAALVMPELRPTLGLLVAQYTVASRCNNKTATAAVVASLLVAPAAAIRGEMAQSPGDDVLQVGLSVGFFIVALTLGTWGLGRWVRWSRSRMEDLEVSRAAAAAAARAEERHLIALELHDIVSHSVSVMVLQADGARAVLTADPAQAERALEHIGEVGRESVGELRRLLGVLADGSISPTTARERQPGLEDITLVVEDARRTGLNVAVEVSGTPPVLPQSFERSVHRIVKESLANSLKHSGPGTSASVRFFWSRELLILEITDDGAGGTDHPALSTGHGLAGLRERASALDGRLDTAPAPGGRGYVVTATLPIPTPATATVGSTVDDGRPR